MLHLNESFRNYLEFKFCQVWSPRSPVSPEETIRLFLNGFDIRVADGRVSLENLLKERVKKLEAAQRRWEPKPNTPAAVIRAELTRIYLGLPSRVAKIRQTMGRGT